MKNYEMHGFRPQPLCDCHMHLHVPMPLDRSVEIYRAVMEHTNCDRIALQALPALDPTDNYKAFYFKSVIEGVYACPGLFHHHDERDTYDFYLEHIKALHAMGCDGFKMWEGKPICRKDLGKRLDDPCFDGFYGFAQEKELPILLHFADPRYYWDPAQWTDYMIKVGWNYDDSFISFEDLLSELEGILEKFPKLHLIVAHFWQFVFQV